MLLGGLHLQALDHAVAQDGSSQQLSYLLLLLLLCFYGAMAMASYWCLSCFLSHAFTGRPRFWPHPN